VDRVSIERMCAGREFQVESADTEKAREEKLLVIPAGLVIAKFHYTDPTRTKSAHVVEYELNSATRTRTRTRHGPDTDKVRARCRVRAKFYYTDPTGPARTQRSFAAKKSVRVRVGPVGSVSVSV